MNEKAGDSAAGPESGAASLLPPRPFRRRTFAAAAGALLALAWAAPAQSADPHAEMRRGMLEAIADTTEPHASGSTGVEVDRSRGDGRDRTGAAARVRTARDCGPRLREPAAPHRSRPDDLATLHRRPHDRPPRPSLPPPGARDRHRLRVPGGGPRGAGGPGAHHRDRAAPRPAGGGAAAPARLPQRRGAPRGRVLRMACGRAVRRDHRHRRRLPRAAAARRPARPERGAGDPRRRAVLGPDAAPRAQAPGRRGERSPDPPGPVRAP